MSTVVRPPGPAPSSPGVIGADPLASELRVWESVAAFIATG